MEEVRQDQEMEYECIEYEPKEYTYFKISKDFIRLAETVPLPLSTIYVYLTHARSRGGRVQKYSSIATRNAVEKYFKFRISPEDYEKSMEMLSSFQLIEREKLEKQMGFYQSKERVILKKIERNELIQIPKELIDSFALLRKSPKTVIDCLRMYQYYDPIHSFGGIRHDVFYLEAEKQEQDKFQGGKVLSTFGANFNITLQGLPIIGIYDPEIQPELFTEYKAESIKEKPDSYGQPAEVDVHELVDSGLYRLMPLVFEVDPYDPIISRIKGKVRKGFVNLENKSVNQDYPYTWSYEKDDVIRWLLEPQYPVRNKAYTEYQERESKSLQKAIDLYQGFSNMDFKELRLYLYTQGQNEFLGDLSPKEFEFCEDELLRLQQNTQDDFLKLMHLTGDDCSASWKIQSKIQAMEKDISKAENEIKKENKEISEKTGRRSRLTTSPHLKQLKKSYSDLIQKHNEITTLEKRLIRRMEHDYPELFDAIQEFISELELEMEE